MSEVTHENPVETQQMEPYRKGRRVPLAKALVLFGALLLVLAIVLPALLAPAMGNIFSNVVSSL